MNARLFLLAFWISGGSVMAQTAGSPGEGLCAVPGSTAGTMQICWWGKSGRTYFLQTNATLNRDTWSYTPVLESGGNAVLSYSMPSTAQRMFVRLVYTDLPTGGNASTADFDGDGVPNGVEVAANGPRSDPFVVDTDWDGFSDGVELLGGHSPTNPGSNPNPNPLLAANVNPSVDYINGIKIEYSRKGMYSDYNRSGSTKTTTYRGYHYLPPNGVMSGQDFQPYLRVPGSNATATMVTSYEGAAFLTQRITLPGKLTMTAAQVDTASKSTTGLEEEYRRLERSVIELGKSLSPTAPDYVQRTLLGLVTRRYNGVTQSRVLGTITLGKSNTSWSDELKPFCKATAGERFTFEAAPDGGAPDTNSSSDAESRNESTDLRLISVEVQEVHFSGTGCHVLKSDDGQTTYDAPQWKDVNGDGRGVTDAQSGDKGYPVAYTKGSLPSIGANFKFTGMITGQSYEIKATSLQGVEIPPTAVTLGTDGSVVLPPTPASKGFVNEIEFYDARDNTAFQLDWHIKVGTSNWAKIGSTRHTVCVTHAAPVTTWRNESLFVLACKNAKGRTTEADIHAGIWSEFTDRDVRRVDDTQLTYYASFLCANLSTENLLKFGDGQCGAWVRLLMDMRRVHGLTNDSFKLVRHTGGGLLVKAWSFSGAGSGPLSLYTHVGVPSAIFRETDRYSWRVTEFSDVNGLAGQGFPGISNPASFFENHQLLEFDGKYYDPAMGVVYASPDEIDAAMHGFWIEAEAPLNEQLLHADLNADGDENDTAVNLKCYHARPNPSGLNISIIQGAY